MWENVKYREINFFECRCISYTEALLRVILGDGLLHFPFSGKIYNSNRLRAGSGAGGCSAALSSSVSAGRSFEAHAGIEKISLVFQPQVAAAGMMAARYQYSIILTKGRFYQGCTAKEKRLLCAAVELCYNTHRKFIALKHRKPK